MIMKIAEGMFYHEANSFNPQMYIRMILYMKKGRM